MSKFSLNDLLIIVLRILLTSPYIYKNFIKRLYFTGLQISFCIFSENQQKVNYNVNLYNLPKKKKKCKEEKLFRSLIKNIPQC